MEFKQMNYTVYYKRHDVKRKQQPNVYAAVRSVISTIVEENYKITLFHGNLTTLAYNLTANLR